MDNVIFPDFKAKAEKEREDILKSCDEAWTNWTERADEPAPFTAPDTDSA